jgi:hypothetical protein
MAPARSLWLLIMVGVVVTLIPWAFTIASTAFVADKMAHETTSSRLDIIGNGLTNDVSAYLDLGVPLNKAVGVSDFLASDLAPYDYIRLASITATDGYVVGSYKRPGATAAAPAGKAKSFMRFKSFPIASSGKVVARLDLIYEQPTASGQLGIAGLSFVIALLSALVFGLQFILSSFRRSVMCPMQVADALERRIGERRFDTRAPTAEPGPVADVFEQINQLLVAVNERVARCRSYLTEVREYSYNPAAAPAVERLEQQLEFVGRFAPDGMRELKLDHGDLLAGPSAFRVAAMLTLLLAQAMKTGLLPAPQPLLIVFAAVAVAGLIHEVFGSLRLWVMPLLALAALVAMHWLVRPEHVAVALAAGAFAATAAGQAVMARHPVVRAGIGWHGLLGIFAALGVSVLGFSLDLPALSWLAALIVLGGLAALGMQSTGLPRLPAGETRSVSGKLIALIELMPAVLFMGGLGLWLGQTGHRLAFSWATAGTGGLLTSVWIGAGVASLSAGLALLLLRSGPLRVLPHLLTPLCLFVLAAVFWFAVPPLYAVLASVAAIGIGVPAALGLIARSRGGALFPWAAFSLAVGTAIALDPPRQPMSIILFALAAASVLFLVLALISFWLQQRSLRRSA